MKKGISLVILVITLIVMVILASVAIINSEYLMADTDVAKLKIDISELESLMKIYVARKNGNIQFETIDFSTSGLSNTELEQFTGETITDNKVELYIIDLYEIDAESTNFGRLELGLNDRYLYSRTTGKVYYEQGLESDGVIYYYIKNGEE